MLSIHKKKNKNVFGVFALKVFLMFL